MAGFRSRHDYQEKKNANFMAISFRCLHTFIHSCSYFAVGFFLFSFSFAEVVMILGSEGQVVAMVNMIVNLLKQIQIISGLSLYYSIQLIFWIGATVFLFYFFVNRVSGGADD